MSTSITTVNAKLIADAKQYIAEFERAHRSTVGAVQKIDSEMDKLSRSVKKKFSGAEFGKGLLNGLGIGSGAAVAMTAFNIAKNLYDGREADVKNHQASQERLSEMSHEFFRKEMSDEEKLQDLRQDGVELQEKLNRAKAAGYFSDEKDKVDSLTEKYAKLRYEIIEQEKVIRSAEDARRGALAKRLEDAEAASAKGLSDVTAHIATNGPRESLASLRAQNNEWRKYVLQFDGRTDDYSMEEKIVGRKKLAELYEKENELLKEQAQLAAKVGQTMALSFEDAVFSGEKLSTVLNNLLGDLLRIAFRQSVTTPLAGWLSGAVGGLFGVGGSAAAAGGALAGGGSVSGGEGYLVGERGPELFVPGASGSVVPNHKLGGGGNVYQIDARGTDESVVMRLQAALFALAGPGVVERRALAAHVGTLRRGGGFARALA